MGLMRFPARRVYDAAAPAVLDEKPRRRLRIEGGHPVVGVPPERVRHAPVLELREIIPLADIIQAAHLHHEMMQALLPGADDGEAVVPAIDVEEVKLVWLQCVVADAEPEQVAVGG